MIGKKSFETLCTHARDGLPVRALFITPSAVDRTAQLLHMQNTAHALGLNSLSYRAQNKLEIGPTVAFLRIAHRRLDEELKGLEWHFIHGLEYLDNFEDGDAIKTNLEMMVRP